MNRDVVGELVRRGYVSVDPAVRDPIQRTALLMIGVSRWFEMLPLIRAARPKETP